MRNRYLLRLSFVIAILFLGFVIYVEYDHQRRLRGGTPVSEYVDNGALKVGGEYNVEAIRVRTEPSYFEIKIEKIGWIRAYLPKEYRDQAKIPTIKLFHSCEKPTVVLKENRDAYWIVDVNLTVDNERVNLFDWLSDRGLVFQ